MATLPDTWEQAQPEVEQRLRSLDAAWDNLVHSLGDYFDGHGETASAINTLSKQAIALSEQTTALSRQMNVVNRHFELDHAALQKVVQDIKDLRELSKPTTDSAA